MKILIISKPEQRNTKGHVTATARVSKEEEIWGSLEGKGIEKEINVAA